MGSRSAYGRQTSRPDQRRANRGTRKRLERITLRGNWSVEIWLYVIFVLFLLLVAIPWMVRHPPEHHHAAPNRIDLLK
jgi:hypothetical protein